MNSEAMCAALLQYLRLIIKHLAYFTLHTLTTQVPPLELPLVVTRNTKLLQD